MKQLSDPPATTLLNTTVVGIPWRPDFRLGYGVDAVTGQMRAVAVDTFEVQHEPQMATRSVYSVVRNQSDLSSMISASAKGSYNMEGVTVGAGTSFLKSVSVSELSVSLVAQTVVQRSQYSLAPSYKLKVEPEAGFREKYGDYFVAGYRAGSMLSVVFQCSFTSSEERQKFAASISADVPEVMTAEGSTEFEKKQKEFHASVTVEVTTDGVEGTPPSPPGGKWTPGNILTTLLPWYETHIELVPIEAELIHYRVIDPSISGEVPVSPLIFSKLAYLYDRFWLARAHFNNCPEFGRRLVEEPYKKLEKNIEAFQASLPHDEPKIEALTSDTSEVLGTFNEIFNRQDFFAQVAAAARTEPPKDQNFDADKGRVRWGYGFQTGTMPGVTVTSISDHVAQDWKIGWREHVFTFRDSSKLIVGWDIVCNWADGTGGDWHKACDQIIGHDNGSVYVKSDYDRGYSWSIVWHVVDASLYPSKAA